MFFTYLIFPNETIKSTHHLNDIILVLINKKNIDFKNKKDKNEYSSTKHNLESSDLFSYVLR